jgi:membrane protein CcdC involved in cytochrome C biogenesis
VDKILPFLFVGVVFTVAVMRRMRPQPVRPQRLATFTAIIVVVLGVSALSTGTHLFSDVPALLLAPVAAAVGCAAGFLLVRTTRFWTEKDGQLWMAGGVLFAVVLVVSIALRIGLRLLAASASRPGAVTANSFLVDLSTDLLFLSMGMWLTRAAMVYQRWRQHQSSSLPGLASTE